MTSGIIFDIKRYAVHDGPGIRTTVFFKGCPLRCAWCHNPEGQSSKPEILIKSSRCLKECQECVSHCEQMAISKKKGSVSVDKKKCDGCGKCIEFCTTQAIELVGREVSAQQAMAEIEKDQIFHDESGGGVTFSGGEPLLQADFLNEILSQCQVRGIHTTLDTSGHAPFKVLEKLMGTIDLFLYDLKIMDDQKHRKFTGASNKIILGNLKKLAKKNKNIIIRFPVIPRINDDSQNIQQTAQFILSLQNISQVSLLPYHSLGKDKYLRLDKADSLPSFDQPLKARMEEIKKTFENYGFRVKIGD